MGVDRIGEFGERVHEGQDSLLYGTIYADMIGTVCTENYQKLLVNFENMFM